MSTEENKNAIRRFMKAYDQGDSETFGKFMASTVKAHYPGVLQPLNKAEWMQRAAQYIATFDNRNTTIEDMIAEGDKVVWRYTSRCVHRGALMGILPTGKRVTFTGISITQFLDGKIVEHWAEFDLLGLLQQLGASLQSNPVTDN